MDLKEICIPVQKEVDRLELIISQNLTSRIPFVQSVVEYVIKNGGKRLRPILTILCAKMTGYQSEESIALGAAIEFMHTASLLHDDVLDNASLRRGRVSINNKWGNHVSVLVGDFFYCRAMDILVKHGDLHVLRVVTDSIASTTEGEILEITKSNDIGTAEDDYLRIITNKTAVLIAAACQVGGILGHVSEEHEHALKRFGLNIGIAFQLMDDVLDYTSSQTEFGKVSGTDLKEGKLTLPLIVTLRKCADSELQIIKGALISDEVEASLFKEVLQIINQYDGIRETTALAKSYLKKAKENLSIFKPSLEKETLLTISDYVLRRRS